jgi:hypothetical protein
MRLPEYPKKKQSVEPTVRQIIDYLRAITLTSVKGGKLKQSTSGTTLTITPGTKPRNGRKPMPFEVTLFSELESEGATRTWKVVIADGYVNERIPGGTGDALKLYRPVNIEDSGNRIPFAVTAGKQVSLIVEVDEKGEINPEGAEDAVRVAIEDIDEASTHFEPKIGDASTGIAGVYHYKLATIEESDTPDLLKLTNYLAGSHISHFRELPLLKNLPDAAAADTGRLIKEYDKDSNEYRFRSIAKGDGQLRVDEDGDNVTVRGNGKGLIIRYQVEGESATDVAEFEDGLTTTGADAPGTPTVVTIPIPAVVDDGWWGLLKFQHFAELGDSTPYDEMQLTIENGRIIGVAVQAPGGSLTTVTGTEGTPGTGIFESYAEP